jgi:hypothetical protein
VTVLLFPWDYLVPAELNFGSDSAELELFYLSSELELNCLCSAILLRESFAGWIQNNLFLDTTAASVFITGETSVTVFIPMVTVYYLRIAV